MLGGRRLPIFVRALTDEERTTRKSGRRSSHGVLVRRCQMAVAGARGERAAQIAVLVGGDEKTVRQLIHRFNRQGMAALPRGSSPPHRTPPRAFSADRAEQSRGLRCTSARDCGYPTGIWTRDLAAAVSCARGRTPRLVTGEAIGTTVLRLGIGWKRAKHWITSPDPAYVRKQGDATA